MAYDIIRWICGAVLFVILLVVLCFALKKKGKGVVTAAFISIILTAASFLVPVENYICNFTSVEKLFAYRYNEELVTYFECDEGVICIAERSSGVNVNYCFKKDGDRLLLPFSLVDNTQHKSSKYGVFLVKTFDNQSIIFTQISGTEYNGEAFQDGGMGYYYFVVNGKFIPSYLTYSGEEIVLV
jgi:hypothetical protein